MKKDANLCQNNPCLNGGSCLINSNTGYICVCPSKQNLI